MVETGEEALVSIRDVLIAGVRAATNGRGTKIGGAEAWRCRVPHLRRSENVRGAIVTEDWRPGLSSAAALASRRMVRLKNYLNRPLRQSPPQADNRSQENAIGFGRTTAV